GRLPKPGKTLASLPQVPRTKLPNGWVVYFPPELVAGFGGTGALSADVAGVYTATASFGGSGSLSADFVQVVPAVAAFGGTGQLVPLVVPIREVQAAFGGAGSLEAIVEEFAGISAPFGGVGRLSADVIFDAVFGGAGALAPVYGTVTQFAGSGGFGATVTKTGLVEAGFGGSGSFEPTVSTYTPVGIYKDGNASLTTTLADVAGWLPDSAFPGSTVSGNGVVVASTRAGQQISIAANINNTSALTRQYRISILVNGVAVVNGSDVSISASGTQQLTLTHTMDLTEGDIVKLQARASSSTGATLLGGTST